MNRLHYNGFHRLSTFFQRRSASGAAVLSIFFTSVAYFSAEIAVS